jgi:two-component system chemotaxis sensor kinase CheA
MLGRPRCRRRGRKATCRPRVRPNFVRVDLVRLDDLMRLVGELVVTRSRLEDTLHRIEAHVPFQEWRALQEHSAGIDATCATCAKA